MLAWEQRRQVAHLSQEQHWRRDANSQLAVQYALVLRLAARLAVKESKYSCSSCLACSDIDVPLETLMLEESELLDDDGVSDRCVGCVSVFEVDFDDCGRVVSLEEGQRDPLVRSGNLYGGAST